MRAASVWLWSIAFFAAVLAIAAPVQAQNTPDAGREVSITEGALSGAEARDWGLVQQAFDALTRGGYSALAQHLPALKTAMGRIPADYASLEIDGARVIVRSDDEQDGLARALMASVMIQGDAVVIETRPNVYPMAAMLLASEAVQHRRPEEAIRYLDMALERQPDNFGLVSQRSAALSLLGRHAETVAMIDKALTESGGFLLRPVPAILHRQRGFALIELGRLDDAEAAYRTSLEVQPDHPGALSQLEYIAILRDGGEKRQGSLVRPPAAGEEANADKPTD